MAGQLEVTIKQLEKAGFVDTGAVFSNSKIFKKEGDKEIRIHYGPSSSDPSRGVLTNAYDLTTGAIINLEVNPGLLEGKYVLAPRRI